MKLNYKLVGEGKPVLIVHGLFGMSDNWNTFAKNFATHGFACYLIDLRNHGHSPHDAVHNYKVMADDLAELIADLQLKNVVVIGHSMGGKAAMELLNDYPQLIEKLIVVDIAPYSYRVHHREILDALLSVDLNSIKTRIEAEKKLAEGISDIATRQFLMKNLFWIQPEQLAWRFNLPVLNEQIEEVGKETWPDSPIDTPVLFVRGDKSDYINPERNEEIKKLYVNAQFATIQNSGHWIQAEKPQHLMETILAFLSA